MAPRKEISRSVQGTTLFRRLKSCMNDCVTKASNESFRNYFPEFPASSCKKSFLMDSVICTGV